MHSVQYVHSTQDGDNLIAHMARVSNPSNQNNKDTAPKLIKYLIKHKHWSPFEMVSLCVKITTTRSIASQILRHRSFSFQEFSQRYAEVTDIPVVPGLRRQDMKNRQNSIDDLPVHVQDNFNQQISSHYQSAIDLYHGLLAHGVAKECARDILPLSTPTTIYMHGNLRSWFHYVDLRAANGTQVEHQQIALGVKDLIQQYYPQCYEAFF